MCIRLTAALHVAEAAVGGRGGEGVFAYNLRGELKWRMSAELPGMQHNVSARRVVADDQGHLFINDVINKCVHILSARNGAYLGVVVREGDWGIGTPAEIAWHSESASLVVAHHHKDGVYHLSVFSRQD